MILPGAAQTVTLTPRSWMDVLKLASFNCFAWLAVFIVLAGLWLLFRRQGWTRAAAALAILAGMTLLLMVLKDIKREVPGIRTEPALSGLKSDSHDTLCRALAAQTIE